MNMSRPVSALALVLGLVASADANADTSTIVLNTYNKVLPKMVGDALGPTRTDQTSGQKVPRVGRCTGVGYMDPQLKLDDSPSASANFATSVPLLVTATRTDNQVNPNSNNSYMQGAFGVVNLAKGGPAVDQMQMVNLPRLEGDRAWQKPNIMATNKYYLLVAASEDNGQNNNPQVVAFVYDKTSLAPVAVTNSNRDDSTAKPTNLIELSGRNDGEQYGPHSIARVQGTDNGFVMGLQRNNNNAYVMRVDVVDDAGGVKLDVKYLNRVIDNAVHCRPDVVTNAADGTTAFLTSVEANTQPADIGVRALSFDVNTGRVINSTLIAKSSPGNRKYAVQPTIADLGKYVAISYQMSEATGKGNGTDGHTGGSNLSMLALVDKATMKPVNTPVQAIAPYARHASGIGALWGEAGKEVPSLVSLGGSSTGTGKGLAQILPLDTTAVKFGDKDPAKLYELSVYSDIAGTVVRGKRNPNNQGRGFIYAAAGVPNPGYNGGATAFMPEVKTFIASAVQGYTSADTAKLAARESIYLSLVPASWVPGQPTTPGGATDHPGTNPDGTGPLPRSTTPGTNPGPGASPPGATGAPNPGDPGNPIASGDPNPGGGNVPSTIGGHGQDSSGGCATGGQNSAPGAAGAFMLGLGLLLTARRRKHGGA